MCTDSPFVIDPTGARFVRTDMLVVDPLCFLIDGEAHCTFDGDAHVYLKLDDAIAWFEREIASAPDDDRLPAVLDALRRHAAQDGSDE